MNSFFKNNQSLIRYTLIFLLLTTFFGLNFLVNLIGNILLLLLLVPILLILIAFISFNSLKSKLNRCDKCGTISLGLSNTCINCGSVLNGDSKDFEKPSQSTIEVKAEEIK